MLTVIDTRTCNIQSVLNAFHRIGAPLSTTSDPAQVAAAEAMVLPGVGAFGAAMGSMRALGLDKAVKQRVAEKVPLLGICVGMQLLADWSTEHGEHAGLGLVHGKVIRLESSSPEFRVPNIGWYPCAGANNSRLFPLQTGDSNFYFVHSYHFVCDNPPDVAATFDFGGQRITAGVESDQVFGVQFHPEKSQDSGLDLLERFVNLVRARR